MDRHISVDLASSSPSSTVRTAGEWPMFRRQFIRNEKMEGCGRLVATGKTDGQRVVWSMTVIAPLKPGIDSLL